MSERISPVSLAGGLGAVIKHFGDLSPNMPRNYLPVLEIASAAQRVDKGPRVFQEAENLSGIEIENHAQAGITIAAVPHATAKVATEHFIETARKIFARERVSLPLLEGVTKVPLHLVVWWAGTPQKDAPDTPVRCDLLGLAKQPEEERKAFFEVISRQTAEAVRFMRNVRRQSRNNPYHIKIYGVFGHSTEAERERTGLSRGPQSGPEGHINVVLYDKELYDAVKLREVLQEEKLKQIGPWDTLIFDKLKSGLQSVIMEKVKKRLGDSRGFSVSTVKDYSRRPDSKAAPLSERFCIDFDTEIDQSEALGIVTDIVGHFEDFYQGLIDFYKEYHKSWGNREKLSDVLARLSAYIGSFGFDEESRAEVLGIFQSIQPTYGQIRKWIKEMKPEHEFTAANIRRLEAKKTKYEERNRRISAGEVPESFIRYYQLTHGMTPEEAKSLYRLIGDRFKDPIKEMRDIWFTWPRHISGTYMFEDYRVGADGRIKVKSLSLSPRVATPKGAAEDILGVLPRRLLAV